MSTKNKTVENVRSCLPYLLGFVSGILFLIIEKKDLDIRFHAMQSTLVFGGIAVFIILLEWVPVIGSLMILLLKGAAVILWIILLVRSFRGEMYKLPYVGELSLRQIRKI